MEKSQEIIPGIPCVIPGGVWYLTAIPVGMLLEEGGSFNPN